MTEHFSSHTPVFDFPTSSLPPGPTLQLRRPASSSGCAAVVAIIAGAIVVGVFALIALAVIAGLIPFAHMDALSAAGVFGRGANADLLASLRSVTNVLKANFLGFVGATIVLVVLALAAAHIVGDQRAQEKTARLVQGVLMLVAASGFVA